MLRLPHLPAASNVNNSLARKALAECVGTALLVAAVIGSGISAANLSPGNVGLQLFENAVATAGALVAIILAVGSVSGAHLNPLVTLADRFYGGVTTKATGVYIAAQTVGGILGAMAANVMFSEPVVSWSTKHRATGPHLFAEVIATFGLLLVIFGTVHSGRRTAVPFAVAAYIGGAYFFTSSTSFANPAVAIARMFSNTFAGIAPSSVPGFIAAECIGAVIAVLSLVVLYPTVRKDATKVLVPHEDATSS